MAVTLLVGFAALTSSVAAAAGIRPLVAVRRWPRGLRNRDTRLWLAPAPQPPLELMETPLTLGSSCAMASTACTCRTDSSYPVPSAVSTVPEIEPLLTSVAGSTISWPLAARIVRWLEETETFGVRLSGVFDDRGAERVGEAWPGPLRLEPVAQEDADALIGDGVSEELRARITRAAGGNPLFISEMLTATAMGVYQNEIAQAVVLALFVPLISSSGGNSGSQASTLIVRAMALTEVRMRDWWRVLRREALTGLTLGLVLAVVGMIRILSWQVLFHSYGEHYVRVALTVSLSLVGVVTWEDLVESANLSDYLDRGDPPVTR